MNGGTSLRNPIVSKFGSCLVRMYGVTSSWILGELKCSAGGTYTTDIIFTIEGARLSKNDIPSVASVKAVQFLLPLYMDWTQISWREIDSMLEFFPHLKEVLLTTPWLVGDSASQAPRWCIANQLGLSWSVSDRLQVPDAYGEVSQAIRSLFLLTNRRCDLRIVYDCQPKYTSLSYAGVVVYRIIGLAGVCYSFRLKALSILVQFTSAPLFS